MPDDDVMRALAEMTPSEIRMLRDFAQNMEAARRARLWIAWIGGVATGAAALAFYLHALWTGR